MQRAPKQWSLSKTETINSFENWRQNLVYTLSLDQNFAPFLIDGTSWLKKTKHAPLRGFENDANTIPEDRRRTAQQKVSHLELMLGQIANYCPVISRNTIVKNSTSCDNIWQTIRLHYGFQTTGAHFIDYSDIHLEGDERPEDLYQMLMAFVEDNLLKANGISHHGQTMEEDEELSPTLENLVVLTWLRLIHNDMPKLVKQRYGTELRSRSLASIKPEISQALDSLLDEITTNEGAKIMRTSAFQQGKSRTSSLRTVNKPMRKSCPICKQAGRSDKHFLSECQFLPAEDRRYILKARRIADLLDNSEDNDEHFQTATVEIQSNTSDENDPCANRVEVRQSPYIDTFYQHNTARITIDSGATGNLINLRTAKRLGLVINKSSQSAHQADGSSPLTIVGETRLTFQRDNHNLTFQGLVVENLDVDILGGAPFMEHNDIMIRPAKRQVILSDGSTYVYGSPDSSLSRHAVRSVTIIRAPACTTTIWPGDFIELDVPGCTSQCEEVALEPRRESPKGSTNWPPPEVIPCLDGKIRIPNSTAEPQVLKRNEHICQVRPVYVPNTEAAPQPKPYLLERRSNTKPTSNHSTSVSLDPGHVLPSESVAKFRSLLNEYDSVFNPEFKGYNGSSGPFEARVNMGPVQPPQRKGRLPQYNRENLVQLQEKFDELESKGVFKRPEDVDVAVEYVNPSFLVKKSSGGFRLVTAFADVGRYSKPQPSLMPDVDSTLRQIAQWKYIITTDLTSAFYQIPVSKDSMKYCGVVTPFRGTRVYVRSAMGMPGSETALEELMCRVLGDLLKEGSVAKIADDVYIGGNTPDELYVNFRKFLHALHVNGLCLSAPKTIIAPKKCTILGWIWSLGTLQASPHRINTLSSCAVPEKVKDLRSFIGAYKVLARVIPNCSNYLSKLDEAVAGTQSKDKIEWSEDRLEAFKYAQKALASNKTITLPRYDDKLWVVTDGAVRKPGLGATLYITRSDKLHVAGYFSAKLRANQATWLPCEIEALSIAAAIKHFSPYIIQSKFNTSILTDSKPCVQAYEKLCRGEFSSSPRVSTFLSIVSRYQISVQHVSGSAILQSDFASRNAAECTELSCQICSFVRTIDQAVVRNLTIEDLSSGLSKLPFTNRTTWMSIQSECPDLRRTHAHLKQGTRPSKKVTNARDVKRYLRSATIANDGLLVVPQNAPMSPTRERIVVPRQVLDGLITALHIKLNHPTCHQMKQIFNRYLFALDMDKAIDRCAESCHLCTSLRKVPHTVIEQSTLSPPEAVGSSFATDVITRNRQKILVVRECVTSYTTSTLIEDEQHATIRDALIPLCIDLCPLDGPPAVIRTDPAPAFQALVDDKILAKHRLSIEIGRTKNVNKNPVAEKAVQELETELLKIDPLGGTVSRKTLAVATANLNSRIRTRGLSAREMWTQRDQFSNKHIELLDQELILKQHELRSINHQHSEKSKAPKGVLPPSASLAIGDLVYLYSDGNKTASRNRYLVCSVDENWCNVRKLVGTQLRNASYRVKKSECYKVPQKVDNFHHGYKYQTSYESSDEDEELEVPPPPPLPQIPHEIATPQENGASHVLPSGALYEPSQYVTGDVISDNHQGPASTTILRRSNRVRRQTQFYGDPVS